MLNLGSYAEVKTGVTQEKCHKTWKLIAKF